MTLSLICTCGVRLEVDDTFAGQTITCPDCQRPVKVPAPEQDSVRTSGLALTSLVLALVGAFTVLGTLAAAVLGGLALVSIRQNPGRLSGRRYAVAGIILGAVLTGLSLFAYTSVELFGVDDLLREPQWAGKLDYPESLKVDRQRDGYEITRPSAKWGVLRDARANNAFDFPDVAPRPLLLVLVSESAHVVCVPVPGAPQGLTECREHALDKFHRLDITAPDRNQPGRLADMSTGEVKELEPEGGAERVELYVEKKVRGQTRKYLVRVIHKKDDHYLYLVAAGCRVDRFARLEGEFRQALDSFHLVDGSRPAGLR
jgi:hypothetical protein